MKNFFFVSGLPRSGSTLLMNLLGQNPDVYVTPTSCCHEILWTTRNSWFTFQEHKADEKASNPKNLQRVLYSILNSYHDTDTSIIIDKHRSWIHSIELLEFTLQQKAKIIVPVRDIADILSSFEKLYRSNAHLTNVPGEFISNQTTEGRCLHWSSHRGELGIAYNRLKDCFRRGYGDRLLLVEYDALTRNPAYTMDQIWKFLDMEPISHDFKNVIQITEENDDITPYGKNLHKIRPVVEYAPSDSMEILGMDILSNYKHLEFWRKR